MLLVCSAIVRYVMNVWLDLILSMENVCLVLTIVRIVMLVPVVSVLMAII